VHFHLMYLKHGSIIGPQRRGTARTLSNFCVVILIVCFVSFSVLFVGICVLYYCHRVATHLQLNVSYHMMTPRVETCRHFNWQ